MGEVFRADAIAHTFTSTLSKQKTPLKYLASLCPLSHAIKWSINNQFTHARNCPCCWVACTHLHTRKKLWSSQESNEQAQLYISKGHKERFEPYGQKRPHGLSISYPLPAQNDRGSLNYPFPPLVMEIINLLSSIFLIWFLFLSVVKGLNE